MGGNLGFDDCDVIMAFGFGCSWGRGIGDSGFRSLLLFELWFVSLWSWVCGWSDHGGCRGG